MEVTLIESTSRLWKKEFISHKSSGAEYNISIVVLGLDTCGSTADVARGVKIYLRVHCGVRCIKYKRSVCTHAARKFLRIYVSVLCFLYLRQEGTVYCGYLYMPAGKNTDVHRRLM